MEKNTTQGTGYITATGGEDSRSMLHYYRQSLYFLEGQEMTLSIRRLKWLDKEQEWADIDLAAGTACGLPEGTELLQVCREGDRTILLFRQAEGGPDAPFTFLFRDPGGDGAHIRRRDHLWDSGGGGREEACRVSVSHPKLCLGSHPDPAGTYRDGGP